MIKIKSILWLFVIFSTHHAQADFESASKAFTAGKYEEAFQQYLEAAQQGEHDAQFNVGAMLYRGQGIKQNIVEGYAWITLATQEPNEKWSIARQKLLESFSEEEKSEVLTRSGELFALYGDEAITAKLSPVLLSNVDCDFKLKRAKTVIPQYPRKMLEKAKPGWVDLSFTVAKDGTTRNHGIVAASDVGFIKTSIDAAKKAKYEIPLVNGQPADIHGVRFRFIYRISGGTFSRSEIQKLMDDQHDKASSGSARDRYEYAYLLEMIPTYTGVKLEDKDSNEWYFRSAREGYTPSQFFIGRNLLYGKGCRAEPQKGVMWLTAAARKSQPDAQYLLAVELIAGARMERREQQAIEWLEQAATHDYLMADAKLAWIYATHPDPTIRDVAKAKMHLSKISDQYLDLVTLNEASAAVNAESGVFDKAVEFEKVALAEAKSLDFPENTIQGIQARLQSYQAGTPWREAIQ